LNYTKIIEQTARNILAENPSPVVRYLLMRDVLNLQSTNNELIIAKQNVNTSRYVKELAGEQWQDGGWGNFHGIHSNNKQKIPTTEIAIARAVAIGLDISHPVLAKAAKYIINILQGKIVFPDRPEKNDRWETGKQLFLASTLAMMNPSYMILDKIRKLWISITEYTFQSGKYSEGQEISIHKKLTGATVQNSYLVLRTKYHLTLLAGALPIKIETSYICWIWNLKTGIGYLDMPLTNQPQYGKPGPFDRWFVSMELLSRFPRSWKTLAKKHINWLWQRRNKDGLWDFGAKSNTGHYFPLSDNWKIKQNRINDWSTRTLILLRRYYNMTIS
jgi:hypothetical protein